MDLGWKQFLRQNEVFGLDIDSSAVKLIQLRKDGTGYVVTAAGMVDFADVLEDDDDSREANTVNAIRQCLQSAGVQTQLAVCGVSGPEVAVRHFEFPSLPLEEMEGAVLLEAAQVCPFNTENGAVDYQLVSGGNVRTLNEDSQDEAQDTVGGVLVAATNRVIKSKVQLAKSASLSCVLMDVDGLALLNCLNEYEKCEAGCVESKLSEPSASPMTETSGGAGQATAVLNVGASYATLAIMGNPAQTAYGAGSPFIRDIVYAGSDILAQIAYENGVSAEQARKVLFGWESSAELESKLCDSLGDASQKLILDITETLRYYAAQEKSDVVERIFVCGGFALVKGFVELLDSRLPAKVVLWDPFDKIRCDAGQRCRDILQKNGPAMAVAAGLAMRSI